LLFHLSTGQLRTISHDDDALRASAAATKAG
jgi:hypothetical protein